jgi:hypothetical protein
MRSGRGVDLLNAVQGLKVRRGTYLLMTVQLGFYNA